MKMILLCLVLMSLTGCQTYYRYSDWAEKTFDPDYEEPKDSETAQPIIRNEF